MLRRQRTGSVICSSCGVLVGVNDDKCYNCGRRNPGMWGFAPLLRSLGRDLGFIPFVMGTCVVVYVLTLIASGGMMNQVSPLSLLGPSQAALLLFGESGAVPIFIYHRWWTVLSAAWLHAGLLHILFNMMAARNLGFAMADLIGPSRTVIIYTVSGVAGFLLSSTVGVPYTMGASASICGLLGAMLHYGRKSGSSMIHTYAVQYALMLVVMGFAMSGIDNYAHAGGFAGGYAVSAFFNPLTRERGDHMLVAIICLVASFLAIAYGVIHGLTIGLYR